MRRKLLPTLRRPAADSSLSHTPVRLAGALALVLAASGCASRPEAPPPSPEQRVEARGEPIDLRDSPLLDEIAALEDQRTTGDGRLLTLLVDADDDVRARAAQALGRLPYPEFGAEVTDPLCTALEDPVTAVRVQAIFGLGLRADPRSSGVLAAYRNDPEAEVRARVVEAASRIDDPALHAELLVFLRDSDLQVRIQAALATARWDPGRADSETIERALLDALRPYLVNSSRRPRAREVETELAWRILYSLSRRRSALGRGAYLEYSASADPLERLFAVQGLAFVPFDEEVLSALELALRDAHALAEPDWRVSYEAARALGQHADARALPALLAASENGHPHVRAAAFEALGRFPTERKIVVPVLRRGLLDVSTSVRVAALRSMAEVFDADDALQTIERFAREEDPVVRAGAAEAAGELEDERVVPLLTRLVRDSDLRVSTTAVQALGGRDGVRATLHGLLAHSDNGVRLAAVLALRERSDPTDAEPLVEALRSSKGDIAAEIAFSVLENLAAIGGPQAEQVLREALDDPRPHVRRVARRALKTAFNLDLPATPPASAEEAASGVPRAGTDYPRWRYNPLVEITTSRGTLVFELFPAEAPGHVHSFLQLAAKEAYSDLSFHRVVPDFVVQGGDYRGDGNGGRPWRGESLRHEFGTRPFVRGSLGMPRNEDFDSGGGQFFITHRPTPHLDGRYTVFGELREGQDVLDRIEVGDRILSVQLLK